MPVTSPVFNTSPRWMPWKCNMCHEGGFNPSCNFPTYTKKTNPTSKLRNEGDQRIQNSACSETYHTDAMMISLGCKDKER
jgi:hypothetical protein